MSHQQLWGSALKGGGVLSSNSYHASRPNRSEIFVIFFEPVQTLPEYVLGSFRKISTQNYPPFFYILYAIPPSANDPRADIWT